MRRLFLTVFSVLFFVPVLAHAHGVNGHIWVTDRAVDLMPEGELKAVLSEPAVREALQIGAVFPDTGYAIGDAYGEMTHWEPFVEAFIAWVGSNRPPPWTSVEDRRLIAFFLGAAAHGMEDEIFDSLFLPLLEEHDGKGQDVSDTACDVFLIVDGHSSLKPPLWVPAPEMAAIIAQMGHDVAEKTFVDGMEKTGGFPLLIRPSPSRG